MFEFRWLWKCLKGTRLRYLLCLGLQVLLSFTILIWPNLTSYIVGNIVIGVDNGSGEVVRRIDMLLPLMALWAGAVLLKSSLNLVKVFNVERSSQQMIKNIRMTMFDSLQALDMGFYEKNRTGDLMTRLTGDLDLVRHTVSYIVINLLDTVIIFFSTIIYFFTVNWIVTLCLLALLPFMYITNRRFSKEMRPLHINNREKLSALNGTVQENIEANRVVRAFAREDYEIEKFDQANQAFLEANLKTNKTWLSIWPIPEFLAQFLTVVVLVVGGILTVMGQMSIAEVSAFMSIVWALSYAIRMLGTLLNDFQRFFPSADKVIEIYYARSKIATRHDAVTPAGRMRGDIEFKNVSFQAGNHEILKNISFKVPAGTTLAVIGETGAGKTTLINLLARFYDVTDGSVTVDGVDVRMMNLQALRSSIGMATQDVFLFSDTIDGNIAFGRPDMPEEEVRRYAVQAAADEFITRMEEGYDTIIGERGVGLSGGQRQRVALARALAVRPSILVLDDTTSAVDLKTERYIWNQLSNLDFPCTKIIIAQRISTVRNADQILVMKKGQIIERGTHDELMALKGDYYQIERMQSQQTE